MSPLSTTELNRLADTIVASDLTIYIHTGAPGSAGTANRVSQGGGAYQNGKVVAAAGWSNAASGDVSNVAAVEYGAANGGNPGTITHWTAFRGNVFVASGVVTSTTVNDGGSFEISAGEVEFLGATT